MPSLTSLVEKRFGRDFVIFHPCEFSPASEVAFAHALKIALQSEAKLDLMHVESSFRAEKPYWPDFPAVRDTLVRWGVLPKGIRRQDVCQNRFTGQEDSKVKYKPSRNNASAFSPISA